MAADCIKQLLELFALGRALAQCRKLDAQLSELLLGLLAGLALAVGAGLGLHAGLFAVIERGIESADLGEQGLTLVSDRLLRAAERLALDGQLTLGPAGP